MRNLRGWLLAMPAVMALVAGCARHEDNVARVGELAVSRAEFIRVLDRRIRLTGVAATDRDKAETVNSLVDHKLLYQEGMRLGLQPTPAAVDAAVNLEKARFAREQDFVNELQRQGLTREGFRAETVENLVADSMRERLAGGGRVSEAEAEAYFRENAQEFARPGAYRILLIAASDEGEARRLLARLGNSFVEFDRYALEEGPAEQRRINRNALLTPEGDFPAELILHLKKMKKGEVGGPLLTRRGWFIFRLLDRQEGKILSWTEARAMVFHSLSKEKSEASVAAWLQEQRKRVKIDIYPGKL